MALSPAHQFGQIIGDVVEVAILPLLEDFTSKHRLYLDKKGERPCRKGLKCRWQDSKGNWHDLDFVLERGGAPDRPGTPVAFIETAWRRYTKHSRNKAQEIQGAILPLAQTYRHAAPFMGVVLAGVFTKGALDQLKSLGFTVIYFSYERVLAVFDEFRIDAAFDEDTPDSHFKRKVKDYRALSTQAQTKLARQLLRANEAGVQEFVAALTKAVSRKIERVIVLPLHGTIKEVTTVIDAIDFITRFEEHSATQAFQRYEIQIRYSNGDSIEANFADKETAIRFLRGYTVAQRIAMSRTGMRAKYHSAPLGSSPACRPG